MLIKEYRIPMPLSVEEYRIAQLYMINRKSREESEGEGSGIEIRVNEPYKNGPNNTSGQYTEKIYYVAKHVPPWMVKFMSENAVKTLSVEEISHNAYPFTKTIQSTPMFPSFSVEIETHFKPDLGEDDKIFSRKYPIETLDFNDRLGVGKGGDNVFETDPRLFVSKKDSSKGERGPLPADWLKKARQDMKDGKICPSWNADQTKIGYSCAYKVVKVNFKVFYIGSKVEQFIHNSIIKPMLCQAHRQVWCWQDEWCDLTLEDIRREEKITMKKLREMFHGPISSSEDEEEVNDSEGNEKELINEPWQPIQNVLSKKPSQSVNIKTNSRNISRTTNYSSCENQSPNISHDSDFQTDYSDFFSPPSSGSERSSCDEFFSAGESLIGSYSSSQGRNISRSSKSKRDKYRRAISENLSLDLKPINSEGQNQGHAGTKSSLNNQENQARILSNTYPHHSASSNYSKIDVRRSASIAVSSSVTGTRPF